MLFGRNVIDLPPSFHADFTQRVTAEHHKQILYRGTIDFSSPDRFKWRYTSPGRKEVCTDGKKLEVVDHELEQVTRYKMGEGLNLQEILRHAQLHRKSVYIAKFEGKNYTIQLNSRQELSRIAYRDELEHNVLIIFSKMHYGKRALPESRMNCSFPESYDRLGW